MVWFTGLPFTLCGCFHYHPPSTSGAAASAARSAKLGDTEGKVLSARDRSSAETSSCAGVKCAFYPWKILKYGKIERILWDFAGSRNLSEF